MAILTKTTTQFQITNLAPAGTFAARCLEIEDSFGVQRPAFKNPQVKVAVDIARFLFGFRGTDGNLHRVQTFEFRISGSAEANLMKFLTSWLGQPPQMNWDYCELKGEPALITVAHRQSRDGTKTFANITAISPVPEARSAEVLPVETFNNHNN